jgi:hypothetical protein
MKYPEGKLLSDLTLRQEKNIKFYQSRKWCQGDFEILRLMTRRLARSPFSLYATNMGLVNFPASSC